jgi:hypothetical protein
VPVPEFKEIGTITLLGMSGTQRDAWEKSLVVGRGNKRRVETDNVRARLVVKCAIDPESGERVFTDADAAVVGAWRVDVLNRLFEVAQRLSGVSDKDADELDAASATSDGSGSPTN